MIVDSQWIPLKYIYISKVSTDCPQSYLWNMFILCVKVRVEDSIINLWILNLCLSLRESNVQSITLLICSEDSWTSEIWVRSWGSLRLEIKLEYGLFLSGRLVSQWFHQINKGLSQLSIFIRNHQLKVLLRRWNSYGEWPNSRCNKYGGVLKSSL